MCWFFCYDNSFIKKYLTYIYRYIQFNLNITWNNEMHSWTDTWVVVLSEWVQGKWVSGWQGKWVSGWQGESTALSSGSSTLSATSDSIVRIWIKFGFNNTAFLSLTAESQARIQQGVYLKRSRTWPHLRSNQLPYNLSSIVITKSETVNFGNEYFNNDEKNNERVCFKISKSIFHLMIKMSVICIITL